LLHHRRQGLRFPGAEKLLQGWTRIGFSVVAASVVGVVASLVVVASEEMRASETAKRREKKDVRCIFRLPSSAFFGWKNKTVYEVRGCLHPAAADRARDAVNEAIDAGAFHFLLLLLSPGSVVLSSFRQDQ